MSLQAEFIKGIDRTKIIKVSEKIREAWNDYFLESQYCQKQINFGPEEKTNYMGDMLNYFDDTVELLERIPLKSNYQLALYDTVSVLQLMYIGQDLIDELRFVFKMSQSSGTDKLLIRTLRNELTGHPISRDKKNNFISSVFFTRNSHGEIIEYLRYHKDKDYKPEVIRHEWSELVRTHEAYLLENLNDILATIKSKLKRYQNQLAQFLKTFPKISLEGMITKTEHLLETFFEHSNLYSTTNLHHFFRNQDLHPRYKHCIDCFLRDLNRDLLQVTANLKQFRADELRAEDSQSDHQVMTRIVFTSSGEVFKAKPVQPNIRYHFSKLREKHPVFGIEYFIESYQDDPVLLCELKHMQSANADDREFYCSYEYLRHLFTIRGLL
ncbi:hypothetical protein PBAL39_04503 [Pedobacter sp. BAL39]|uniref:hypothetical protein n=1 Tax=Pedobacter sp. BAL39 TaxID=391596 RepID=UPI0001559DDF|nr:hypothetical protein [Pedobacter sp. BAL39]EDM37029.1 hypothetical protein PBAL39_04503 [Pedobacter sp. BAL39]